MVPPSFPCLPSPLLSCVQVDEIEERMEEALMLYRVAEDNPERDDDVNQAVDSIQSAVSDHSSSAYIITD